MSEHFWRQAWAVARRDLDRERRSGEVVWITIPFGAIALLLIPLAVGINQNILETIGAGMLFVVVMLFGMLIAVRRTNVETPAQRDAMALLGIDPAAEFTGKTIAGTLLLLAFELVMGVVAVVLYDIDVGAWAWMVVVMAPTAIGLAELGTLSGSITTSLSLGPALVPLLVAPLAIPLLLGATQTVEAVHTGGSIISWFILMMIVVLVLAIVGVMTARPMQEIR